MVALEQLHEAAESFRLKMNANAQVKKLLAKWSPTIHFTGTDGSACTLTVTIKNGEALEARKERVGQADLEVLGTSQDLYDIFSGRLNPTQKYLDGEIRVKGNQSDVIKLDAITMLLWPEED